MAATVSADAIQSTTAQALSTGAIVGSVAGGLAGLAIFGLLIAFILVGHLNYTLSIPQFVMYISSAVGASAPVMTISIPANSVVLLLSSMAPNPLLWRNADTMLPHPLVVDPAWLGMVLTIALLW